jgi:hypothetical protein
MYCDGLVLFRVAKKDIGVSTTMGTYFAQGAKDADVSATTGNPFYFATTKQPTLTRPFYFTQRDNNTLVSATTKQSTLTEPFYFATTSSVTTNQPTLRQEQGQGREQGQGQGAKTKANRCLLI